MKILTFSFDDGTIQDKRLVGILNKYNLKATFNLNSGLFGQNHRIIHDGIDCDHTEITSDIVCDLYKGHEIAVHTRTHPNLLELNKEGIIKEVLEDKIALEALCGYKIIGMAYPGGPLYNGFVIDTILENTGIYYARTTRSHYQFSLPTKLMEWHPTCSVKDEKLFKLVDEFINSNSKEDMLFYIWGHSFEFDKFKSWEKFLEFCKIISNNETIIYATNSQVLQKISEKRGTK